MEFCQEGAEAGLRRGALGPGARRTVAGVRVGGAGGGLPRVGDRLAPGREGGLDGAAAHPVRGSGDAAGRIVRRRQLGRGGGPGDDGGRTGGEGGHEARSGSRTEAA